MAQPPMDSTIHDDLDAHNQQETDAEGRGGDHRPSQDNGTQGRTSYQMGNPSGNAMPSGAPIDQRWTPGEANVETGGLMELDDYGLNENVEVGHNQSIANYGIEGPAAGGGIKRNKQE